MRPAKRLSLILLPTLLLLIPDAAAAPHAPMPESWQAALARMPLHTPVTKLARTNCIPLMLDSFQPNQTVKALVFMPGAVNEFHFFRRASASLNIPFPTLLDAVEALETQTRVRTSFRPPLLLLHTDEDLIEPVIEVLHEPTANRLRGGSFGRKFIHHDRAWPSVYPALTWRFKIHVHPAAESPDAYHFYRFSLAAFNLTQWEALEAIALVCKSKVTVQRRRLVFESDLRPSPNLP